MENKIDSKTLAIEIAKILDKKKAVDVRVLKVESLTVLTDGFDSKNWVLLDYSSVIVHVFVPNTRTYYDLEHLWADGEPMDISEYLTPENSL